MVRILQRAKLTLEKNILARSQSLVEIRRYITHIRFDHIPVLMQCVEKLCRNDRRLVVQMLEDHVFLLCDPLDLLFQELLIKELAHLETDLCILVRVKRCDPRLRGAK